MTARQEGVGVGFGEIGVGVGLTIIVGVGLTVGLGVGVGARFAEGKDWHGMRRFRLRRLWRINYEALMRAAGQNLKRFLKKRGWGRHSFPVEAFCAFFLASCWWLTRPCRENGFYFLMAWRLTQITPSA